MNKFYISLILICTALHAVSQNTYEEAAGKFFRFYNAQTPDSLFNICSPELQEKISMEKTNAILSGMHIQYGDMKSLRLLKQDSGFNIYKAAFQHQTFCLLLELDSSSLINGYKLVPYDAARFPEEKNSIQ